MKLSPSDPDLATLHARISRGDLDLQPGFQRQEVWPDAKKRRLIDTILRDWHVPPVHVVEIDSDGRQEVLDGQQRLAAIRDFMDGRLRVDGHIDPQDDEITGLHGMKYTDLPDKYRRRFERYALRVIILTDYSAEEPGELFFRLNQQSTLTAPEQRNAFFGPARDQVKRLVSQAEKIGLSKSTIGFSNSRMAYDDVVARFCEALEAGTIQRKITANAVTDRYRSKQPFSGTTVTRAGDALTVLVAQLRESNQDFSLNKATCHSWLCFVAAALREDSSALRDTRMRPFLPTFEVMRVGLRLSDRSSFGWSEWAGLDRELGTSALRMYNDRASSRVADVSSVLVRDYVTWLFYQSFAKQVGYEARVDPSRSVMLGRYADLLRITSDSLDTSETLGVALERSAWGSIL